MDDVTQTMPQSGLVGEPTQVGTVKKCAVCQTVNSGLEKYCSECGFLLDSQLDESVTLTEGEEDTLYLIDQKSGIKFRLADGENSVGRENCDVLLADSSVSRKHAKINVDSGGATVTDLGSTNGTMVDGARVDTGSAVELPEGATVRFGAVSLIMTVHPDVLSQSSSASDNSSDPLGEFEAGLDKTLVGSSPVPIPFASEPLTAQPSTKVGEGDILAKLVRMDNSGSDIQVTEGDFTIGRRKENLIVLSDDAFVSGKHALLSCKEGAFTLTDVGSSNGTIVNGAKIAAQHPIELHDGDEMVIGNTQFRFEIGSHQDTDETETPLEVSDSHEESEES